MIQKMFNINHQNLFLIAISCFVMISLYSNNAVNCDSQYSDLPPPPTKPDRFTSKQQLKEYLVKLHEYYAIIGRPRFGRSYLLDASRSTEQQDSETLVPTNLIIEIIDQNGDGYTTKEELFGFLKLFQHFKH
jgi:hypothetical protein